MQTVEQVIEELRRFNPGARVNPPVEIQGTSPATECSFSFPYRDEEIKKLEFEVESLGGKANLFNSRVAALVAKIDLVAKTESGEESNLVAIAKSLQDILNENQ